MNEVRSKRCAFLPLVFTSERKVVSTVTRHEWEKKITPKRHSNTISMIRMLSSMFLIVKVDWKTSQVNHSSELRAPWKASTNVVMAGFVNSLRNMCAVFHNWKRNFYNHTRVAGIGFRLLLERRFLSSLLPKNFVNFIANWFNNIGR